jgi:lantibiotic biosynthesis protein
MRTQGEHPTLLEGAERIGARLCRDAVRSGGRCAWVTPSMERVDDRWQVVHRVTGPDLYGGTAGIALFLAHLHTRTGDPVFGRTAAGAMSQALARLPGLHPSSAGSVYSGALGVMLVLFEMWRLTGEGRWLDALSPLAEVQAEAAPRPGAIDVIMGSAGAIPVLLALSASLEDPRLTDLALRHGGLLLQTARRSASGWCWDTLDDPATPPLTGFAHGASGIAWALLELHHATGDSGWLHAAGEAVRFERGLFDPVQGNWPDLRDHRDMGVTPGNPVFGMAWCHGAPGIGLARLRGIELARSARRTRPPGAAEDVPDASAAPWCAEAEVAIRTTRTALAAALQSPPDALPDLSLCHGVAGWTELLVLAEATGWTGPGDLRTDAPSTPSAGTEARHAWERLLLVHHDAGRPWPCGVRGGGEVPGLMLGTAGIGLHLLRLAVLDPPPPATMLGPGTMNLERARTPAPASRMAVGST